MKNANDPDLIVGFTFNDEMKWDVANKTKAMGFSISDANRIAEVFVTFGYLTILRLQKGQKSTLQITHPRTLHAMTSTYLVSRLEQRYNSEPGISPFLTSIAMLLETIQEHAGPMTAMNPDAAPPAKSIVIPPEDSWVEGKDYYLLDLPSGEQEAVRATCQGMVDDIAKDHKPFQTANLRPVQEVIDEMEADVKKAEIDDARATQAQELEYTDDGLVKIPADMPGNFHHIQTTYQPVEPISVELVVCALVEAGIPASLGVQPDGQKGIFFEMEDLAPGLFHTLTGFIASTLTIVDISRTRGFLAFVEGLRDTWDTLLDTSDAMAEQKAA